MPLTLCALDRTCRLGGSPCGRDHLRISENSGESECGPDLSDGEVHVDYRTVRIAHVWVCRLFTDFYLRAICP